MQLDRTYQVIARHAIVFDVSEFTIQPGTCCQLRQLALPFVHRGHYQVMENVVTLYERMQAKERPCHMRVAVSRPLTRQQGDDLNQQRNTVSSLVGWGAGKATGVVVLGVASATAGALAGTVAGALAAWGVQQRLPTFHAGDVLVSLFASVSGGIGPQSSSVMLIL
ncbi:hypothetical protein [Pseudomonas xantholysinigenes]|uniref:Uncharacterized protein n=1 Tax=Pseudomonas xantholysinigenes TaxID=2745490 RepID=A0A9E6PUH2_9PSED|nr:hypothetical protein [Pseudomonas xantholysinigenes]QXI37197.1 hypothetical protein HU772_017855 [Pseudomonas xantholysinigenes]